MNASRCTPREPELFDAGNDLVFCFNPGGRFHGWLLRRIDGKLTALLQLTRTPYVPGTNLARLLPATEPREPSS